MFVSPIGAASLFPFSISSRVDVAFFCSRDNIELTGHDFGLMMAYAYTAHFPRVTERVVLMEEAPQTVIPAFIDFIN